ncbi:MAG TPA: glutathione S-transferase family protein [Steroidobacteraceae bacterium]|jgi:glutathione S-transferase
MKLFYSPASPFARTVRAAAIELGLVDRLELVITDVVPGKPNRPYAEAANPLRKIPALEVQSGLTIYDSAVICEYLDSLAPGGVLYPKDATKRWRVLTNYALTRGMCDAAVSMRYEVAVRPEPHRWNGWVEDQWDRVEAGLKWFEQNPAQLEGVINIAHLGLASLLGYVDFRWGDRPWRPKYPQLAKWFDRVEQRPSLSTTKPAVPK